MHLILSVLFFVLTFYISYTHIQVFSWTGEQPPDRNRPLDAYYDESLGRLMTYSMEVSLSPSLIEWPCLYSVCAY